MKKIILFVYIIVVLSLLSTLSTASNPSNSEIMNNDKSMTPQTHGVIIINNDTQLLQEATSENWSGHGTAAEPYIIENYNIDATGHSVGIYLGNTTKYVVIRDSHIYNSKADYSAPYYWRDGAGIKLYRASNVHIENISFEGNKYGIYGDHSSDLIIARNYFSMDSYAAISFASTSNAGVYENTMFGESITLMGTATELGSLDIPANNTVNGKSIYFYKGTMNNVTVPADAGEVIASSVKYLRINALSLENGTSGIQLFHSSHIYVSNVSIKNMKDAGIYEYNTYNLVVEYSVIYRTSDSGITLFQGGKSIISNNDISQILGGSGAGINIRSSGNTVERNYVHDIRSGYVGAGIYMDAGNDNQIRYNLVARNHMGIQVGGILSSSYNNIFANTICNSSYYGIYVKKGEGNNISANILSYNHGSSLTFSSSTVQARDDYGNNWNTSVGNYWLDWALNNYTNDHNNDNYVDWPYLIDGSANVNDSRALKNSNPGIPCDFRVSGGNSYVNLTWKEPVAWGYSPDGYKIYRDNVLIATLSHWNNYYNDTTVLNGQYYSYYILATNTKGWESKGTIERIAVPLGNNYTEHDTIRINGDAELDSFITNEGLKGSGTAWDPYIISGYSINGAGKSTGIYVGNTTKYFTVRNCYIYNFTKNEASIYNVGAGIILFNLKNATISGSTLDNVRRGIAIYMATGEGDIIVENNKIIAGAEHYSVVIYSTTNVTMRNNTMENGGIYIYGNATYASTHTIIENTVNGRPVYYYANIDGHSISVPRTPGEVIIANSTYLNVENANLDGYGSDILVLNSQYIYVVNSTLSHGNIVANSVKYVRITNNTLNGGHMLIQSFDSGAIERNKLRNTESYRSIYMTFSDSNYIRWNIISEGDYDGIWVWSSSYNVIARNQIYNVSRNGIAVDGAVASEGNLITANIISGCGDYGLYMGAYGYGAVNTTIYGNSFYYNHGSTDSYDASHVQAYDDGTGNLWNTTEGNFWYDWTSPDSNHNGTVDNPYKIDGSANSADSRPKSVSVPAPPLNLCTNTGNGFVNLTWNMPVGNGSSEIVSFRIYRNGTLIATVPATQLWYNDTNVSNGITYTYYVTAVNSAGESEKSNEVSATPVGEVPEFSAAIWVALILLVSLFAIRRRNAAR